MRLLRKREKEKRRAGLKKAYFEMVERGQMGIHLGGWWLLERKG